MCECLMSTGYRAVWSPKVGRWTISAPDGRTLQDQPRTLHGVAWAAERDLLETEAVERDRAA